MKHFLVRVFWIVMVIGSIVMPTLFLGNNDALGFDSGNYTSSMVRIDSANLTVSIESANLTIGDLQTALESAANITAQQFDDTVSTIYESFILLLMGAFLVIIAAATKDSVFYMAGGFGMIILGFPFWTTNHWMSILFVLAGAALIAKAFRRGT